MAEVKQQTRADTFPQLTDEHSAQGSVSQEEWEAWHHNRRVLMKYTCEKDVNEVENEFLQSTKFMKRWNANCNKFAVDKIVNTGVANEFDLNMKPCAFGASMRHAHFSHISGDGMFFNSASYGATPAMVTQARQSLEALMQQNNVLWRYKIAPLRVREAACSLANVIGADPANLTFVPNADYGTNVILKSQPWEKGDSMLVFSCDYDVTILAYDWLRWHAGVEIISIDMPLPASESEIIHRVAAKLTELRNDGKPMPKLANICHVTSKTGTIFPVKNLVKLFHENGISVAIDGALAAGHIELNTADINADYYVGTMHKWMYTPPGVGFLVVHPLKKTLIQPLVVSNFYEKDFVNEFAYTGLQDFTPYISAKYAIEFVEKVCGGYVAIRRYIYLLAKDAAHLLARKWDTCVANRNYGAMPIIQLPLLRENPTEAAANRIQLALLERNITTAIHVQEFGGKQMMVIRLAVQIFHELSDFERLGDVILGMDCDKLFADISKF